MQKNDYIYVHRIGNEIIDDYYTVKAIGNGYVRLKGDFRTMTVSIYDLVSYQVIDRDVEEIKEQQWNR